MSDSRVVRGCHLHHSEDLCSGGVYVPGEGGNHCSSTTPPPSPAHHRYRQSPLPSSLVTFEVISPWAASDRQPTETWLAPWRRSDRTPGNSSRICPDPVNPSRCWPAEEMLKVRSLCPGVSLSDALTWQSVWRPVCFFFCFFLAVFCSAYSWKPPCY